MNLDNRRTDRPVVHTLQTPTLGDRSYVVELDGWAVAVDVQRDIGRIDELLERRRLRLGAVLETHLHNDYLTGGLVLARHHDARYVVPAGPRLGYSAVRAVDGLTIDCGPLRLQTLDTPGHTDAHAAYVLRSEDDLEVAAFTGGSLLFGATGRSDLLGPELADQLARQQYWSVRRLARVVGGTARLYPTHGFGSFCAAGTAATSGDLVADQLEANPAFLLDEDEFVRDMFGKLDAYPAYYRFMGPRNAGGVDVAGGVPIPPSVTEDELRQRAGRGELVVDLRPRAVWAESHLEGTLSIDTRGSLATWLGWLEPIDRPVTLIGTSAEHLAEAATELHLIGFDRIAGGHVAMAGFPGTGSTGAVVADFADLAEALAEDDVVVIDTRETSEWRRGHVRGALHVATHDVPGTFSGALPESAPWVYCAAGFRATIAASVLERLGCRAIVVDDRADAAAAAGVPWCDGDACADQLCTAEVRLEARST